jgi:hypothetical protein
MYKKAALAAAILVMNAVPVLAGPQCVEMPSGRTLEAEVKAGQPTNEIVEALLRDAEKIYMETARIVGQRPRTRAESFALQETDLLIQECHFQRTISAVSKSEPELPGRLQWTLIRIEQFDNFIFGSVAQVIMCSNTEARLRLRVARELLNYARMEFEGDTKERDWAPNLHWPATHEQCSG